MSTQPSSPSLIEALKFLAARCDGAHAEDGAGFNKLDSDFGKSLAGRDSLSPKQYAAGYRMTRKYRGQLERGGIDYDLIPPAPAEPTGPKATADKVIDLDGDFFSIRFRQDAALVEAMRAIPDRRWDRDNFRNTVPVARCLEIAEFAKAHGFTVTPAAQAAITANIAAAKTEAERVTAAIAASKAEDADIDLPVDGLRSFQKAGVQYALAARRTFIADEMGLGKTVEALTTLEAAGAYPALVVAPKSVIPAWKMECARWLPGRTVQVVTSTSTIKEGVDITLIHYDVIAKRAEGLEGKAALVLDESHLIKTKTAQRTKAIKALANTLTPDPIILLLTGNAIINRPAEIITQLEVLRRLDDLGGFWKVWKRYCGGSQDGAQNLNELNTKLRACCYVRRLKADVLPELPAKTWATVPTALSNGAEYRRAEDDFRSWLRSTGGDVAKADRAEALVRVTGLRKLVAQGKVAASVEWIKNCLDANGKLVVFAHHRDVQAALLTALATYNPRSIGLGEDRAAAVADFQNDPTVRVIVCSLKAGGLGITLTAASNVAFVEQGWTSVDMDQASDRCHRIGQRDAVTAWLLNAPGTVDDYMADIIAEKRDISAQVNTGTAAADEQESTLAMLLERLAAA